MGNAKILVVDDEQDMRIFVSTVVETLGFEAIAAQDGVEALEKASLNPPAIAKKTFLHSIKMLSPRQGLQLPEPEAYMEKPPDANELSRLIIDLLPSGS